MEALEEETEEDLRLLAGVGDEELSDGVFTIAGTGMPGKLIEYDDTAVIFSNPSVKATEDYVSGKFG